MQNQKEYDKACAGVIHQCASGGDAGVIRSSVNNLRQLAALGTLPYVLEWVADFKRSTGRPLLLFGRHTAVLQGLHNGIAGSGLIYGGTSRAKRKDLVSEFTTGRLHTLIGEFQAMGVGLNLQTASDVAFVEFPWTPGEMDQCEDRVHRMGQQSSVSIWLLYAKNSVHEHMVRVLDIKRHRVTCVVDGQGNADRADTLQQVLQRIIKS
jgi:SWI/SNF-related matrix-associated actin-dependent regulator 1 of chromatin subfamily A